VPDNRLEMIRTMQNIALDVVSTTRPASLVFGNVTGVDPLKIRLEGDANGEDLREDQLILTNAVRDHYVWLKAHDNTADGDSDGAGYHDQVTTRQNQDHIHKFPHDHGVLVAGSGGATVPGTALPNETQTQSDKKDHDHNYHYRGGVFKAELGLKQGEKVVMIQAQGGQHWVVLDRFEIPKGKEGSDDTNDPDPYDPDANNDRDGYT